MTTTWQPGQALPSLPEIIDFLDGTDPDTWWAGPTFRSPDGSQHCVLSHIFERWGSRGVDEFENDYSTSYVIGACVNDDSRRGSWARKYPQEHPKDRVIAFLRAMERGEEMTTYESMEAEYQAYLAADREAEKDGNQ